MGGQCSRCLGTEPQPQPREKPSQKESPNSDVGVKPADNRKEAPVKLPHMYEVIVRDVDSPVDKSSARKLYDQLYSGVFLNQNRKKYWVDEKSGSNSFMLFARDLLITWVEDNRYWTWTPVTETSDVMVDAAELIVVWWLEIHARFDTTKLSPGISYEAVFVIMLKDWAKGWAGPVNLRLLLPNGAKQEPKENLMIKPRNQWIEIPVSEFKTPLENEGEMEISMYDYDVGRAKQGLVVKGVIIRPKNHA